MKWALTCVGITIRKQMMKGDSEHFQFLAGTFSEVILSDSQELLTRLKEKDIQNQVTNNPYRILVVDDSITNRLFMMEVLAAFGYTAVLEAENGEKAVQLATATKPDLIFMDLMMPVMDGFEANRKLKQIISTKNIPVIVWTASGIKENECLAGAEFAALLRKPTSMMEIKSILEQFLP